MYRLFLLCCLIFFPNLLFGADNLITNPFYKTTKINFCLNDISNYPIGIFNVKNSLTQYQVNFNINSNIISISESILDNKNILPYTSSMDDYFENLYALNQKYNLSKPFNFSPSDTTQTKTSQDKYVEIADFDIGKLGRASLKVQGNINLQGKLVNQDQELVRSSYKEREQTNFRFDQKQQLNVQGKIGDQVTISLDQNSERDFDWENTVRIDYQGKEDDILQN